MGACTTKCALICVDMYSDCKDRYNNEGQYNVNPTQIKIYLPPNLIKKPEIKENNNIIPVIQSEMNRNINETTRSNNELDDTKKETHQVLTPNNTLLENYVDKSYTVKKESSHPDMDEEFEIIN